MSAANIVVVGAGTMGTAIAETFASAGLLTALVSRNPSRLAGLHDNIQAVSAFPEIAPELIIEAIPEDLDLKRDLLRSAEAAYDGKPVLASNSSGLPLQAIADRLDFPERFLGIHYFHPARELPLVEMIASMPAQLVAGMEMPLRSLREDGVAEAERARRSAEGSFKVLEAADKLRRERLSSC